MHLGTLLDQDIDVNYSITTINKNKVTIASDGWVKEGIGTCAVIFKTKEHKLCFQGPVDCHQTPIESYQFKLTGILTTYYILHCIKEYTQQSIYFNLVSHVDTISIMAVDNTEGNYRGVAAHNRSGVGIITEIETMKAAAQDSVS
eukprot:2104758-Ditylum_brightwellii.AAC.2